MHPRVSALLVAVGAVAALASCGDLTAVEARFQNRESRFAVFALNGTPASFPSAVSVRVADPRPVNSSFAFDIAFDLTDTGTVKLLTTRAVATEISGLMNQVGLQLLPFPFEQVDRAPTTGYVRDSVLDVTVGQTVLVDVVDLSCQSEFSILGMNIRAKLVIDSVQTDSRKIFAHILVNPNCGFRALTAAGELPKD